MTQYNISFAGAGRVAEAFCKEMFRAGHRIVNVVSETEQNGVALAGHCNALWSERPVFSDLCDLIIVAVPDNRLKNVLAGIRCRRNCIVAHTAGSYGMEVFPEDIERKGVIYPLQTFTKGREISLVNVPFFLEASDQSTLPVLENLVLSVGGTVHYADTDQRRMLHVAAIFACNFINHNLTACKEIASRAGFQFSILEPLIRETVSKALGSGPENSQTGPAVRHDTDTIEKHMELLSSFPDLQEMYRAITQSIINHYKNT